MTTATPFQFSLPISFSAEQDLLISAEELNFHSQARRLPKIQLIAASLITLREEVLRNNALLPQENSAIAFVLTANRLSAPEGATNETENLFAALHALDAQDKTRLASAKEVLRKSLAIINGHLVRNTHPVLRFNCGQYALTLVNENSQELVLPVDGKVQRFSLTPYVFNQFAEIMWLTAYAGEQGLQPERSPAALRTAEARQTFAALANGRLKKTAAPVRFQQRNAALFLRRAAAVPE